jgi:DMSO reductase anchor subunit
LVSTSIFAGESPPTSAFVGVSVFAALLSSLHLGKKMRGWRAVLSPATSWLSREVLLFGAFVAIGTAYLSIFPNSRPIGWGVLAVGFATLIAIDRVYATLPLIAAKRYHSANVVLTGLLFVGVFSGNPLVAGVVGGGKLLLYLQRKIVAGKIGQPLRHALTALRVVAGFLVPALAWTLAGSGVHILVIAAVLVGELVDRLEFYAELDVVTPEKQMAIDLRKTISSQVS